jgi:hypothetical protein
MERSLVDLDLHRVADLLPDRSAESLSEWLKQHPEVVTISRDRCGLYADGAALGAPQAQQVADRFHLVLNLSSTRERVLEERSRELILLPEKDPAPTPESVCPQASDAVGPPTAPPQLTPSQQRRQRRWERYEEVVARFNAGESQAAISRAMGSGTEDDPPLAPARTVSRAQAPLSSTSESERIRRLPAAALE